MDYNKMRSLNSREDSNSNRSPDLKGSLSQQKSFKNQNQGLSSRNTKRLTSSKDSKQ